LGYAQLAAGVDARDEETAERLEAKGKPVDFKELLRMEPDFGSTNIRNWTLRGWAINVLPESGAIRECEKHGCMQDRADSHAHNRAIDLARSDPPAGISVGQAVAEVLDVLDSIGDTCPKYPNGDCRKNPAPAWDSLKFSTGSKILVEY
jgi:hypothetical protein